MPTPLADLDTLDAAATLTAVEGVLVERRAAEAQDLALGAHWADLHAADPQLGRNGQRVWHGEDRLVQVGGEGTPEVQELCLSELAISRRVHPHASRRLVADALDLRHRLPTWWTAAHAAALDAEKRRRYVALSQTDEFGLRHVIARVRAGDAAWVDAMVDRVADLLAPRFPDDTTKEVLRSEAFGWLARPADLLDLLTGGTGEAGAAARPRVVLYIHLHEAAVRADHGLARIEDIGPVLSREIAAWLGHAHVSVRPVIDLADQVAFDAYEHPGSLDERINLRTPADSFPHANTLSRHLDNDHVEAYIPGRTGQTGDHSSQPLGRTGHRTKTHAPGYAVRELGPGDYVWRTPHHRYRRVNHLGTTTLTEPIGSGFMSDDPVDRAVAQLMLEVAATGRARIPAHLRSATS